MRWPLSWQRSAPAEEPRLFVAKDAGGTGTLAYPTPTLFSALGGYPSSTGLPVTPLTAIQSSTVYGCTKARSEDLAKVPLWLKKRTRSGGLAPADDHPLARVLRRPNEWMTPFTFKRFIELSICYRGNAYVVIRRGDAGEPKDLIPISPDVCWPEVSPQGTLFYRIRHPLVPHAEEKPLHQDNVLHIKNIGLDAGYMGISPIMAAQEAVGLALATQTHGAVLFRQGAQVAGALTHPGRLSKEAKESMSRSFTDAFAGVQNAFKVPVLEEGVKYEKLGMTAEDAQFLETRRFQRTEICAIFRVPPHKIMDLEKSSYSSLEIGEQAYINDALWPDAEQIAQEFAAKLLFDDERDDLVFDWHWDALLRADRKTRYEAHAIALNTGMLSINEVRSEEGLEAIKGGDEHRVPLNLGAAGGGGDGQTDKPPTGAPGDEAPNPMPDDARTPA